MTSFTWTITLVPAKVQSLLGYVFDTMTPYETINAVVVCVKGDKQSINAVDSLIDQR